MAAFAASKEQDLSTARLRLAQPTAPAWRMRAWREMGGGQDAGNSSVHIPKLEFDGSFANEYLAALS